MDIMLITNIVYGILFAYFIIRTLGAFAEISQSFWQKILIKRKLKKQLEEIDIKGAEISD